MARQSESQYTNIHDVYPPEGGPYSPIESAYAAPSLEEGYPYPATANGNWAVTLEKDGVDGTPDGQRLGTFPVRYYRPKGDEPPDQFWQQLDADKERRIAGMQEQLDADGRESVTPGVYKRGGMRGGADRPPDNRLTQKMSPSTWSFTRLFDQGQKWLGPRRFNGNHFSMADHKRNYEIHAATAVRSRRNTYRLEPEPWDTDIIDMPATVEPVQATYVNPTSPASTRSWRL